MALASFLGTHQDSAEKQKTRALKAIFQKNADPRDHLDSVNLEAVLVLHDKHTRKYISKIEVQTSEIPDDAEYDRVGGSVFRGKPRPIFRLYTDKDTPTKQLEREVTLAFTENTFEIPLKNGEIVSMQTRSIKGLVGDTSGLEVQPDDNGYEAHITGPYKNG